MQNTRNNNVSLLFQGCFIVNSRQKFLEEKRQNMLSQRKKKGKIVEKIHARIVSID